MRHIILLKCIKLSSNKDGYQHYTRSCEGGIEAVEVLPLPFWTIMFDDLFCAEVIASMCRSNQARHKSFFIIPKVCENNDNFDNGTEEMFFGKSRSNKLRAARAYRKTVPSSASFTRFPSSRSTTNPLKLDTKFSML